MKIITPRAKMHAGQDDFFRLAGQCRLDIEKNVCYRAAATFAACNGGNAEGTAIITTILHLDEGARTAVQSRQRFTSNWFQIKRFLREVQQIRDKMVFAII